MTKGESNRFHSDFVLCHSFVIRHSDFVILLGIRHSCFVIFCLLPQIHLPGATNPPPAESAPGYPVRAPENFAPCRRAGRTEKLRPRRKYKLLRSLEDSPAWIENSGRASA